MAKEGGDILPFEDYKLPPLGHAVSGAVGSTIANLFIYPLDMYVSYEIYSYITTNTMVIDQPLDYN